MKGDVITVFRGSASSVDLILLIISAVCITNRSTMSGPMSLGGTMLRDGAFTFFESFLMKLIKKRPPIPVNGDQLSQKEFFREPEATSSKIPSKDEFVLIRWSKHWPTLQLPSAGFQFNWLADRSA